MEIKHGTTMSVAPNPSMPRAIPAISVAMAAKENSGVEKISASLLGALHCSNVRDGFHERCCGAPVECLLYRGCG